MTVSVEIPVFKHHHLEETIESVFRQTHEDWHLYMLSDGATIEAVEIMRQYEKSKNVFTRYRGNQGIYKTRRELTRWSAKEHNCEYILPLDHDDILLPTAIEDMFNCHKQKSNAGIVRARRMFINENTEPLDGKQWFPFEARRCSWGMTVDLHNHSQPYMIRRSAYDKTEGWDGFDEFNGAGEDCDIFLKIEEVADIVLLNKVLYGYRINPHRYSIEIGEKGAMHMYSRLADKTIERRRLRLKRINDMPPFQYCRIKQ
jgi:glycosyltransferase involved in cell wall biosynthesis